MIFVNLRSVLCDWYPFPLNSTLDVYESSGIASHRRKAPQGMEKSYFVYVNRIEVEITEISAFSFKIRFKIRLKLKILRSVLSASILSASILSQELVYFDGQYGQNYQW